MLAFARRPAAAVRRAAAAHRPPEADRRRCSPRRRRSFMAYDLLEHEGRDVARAAAGRAPRASWRRCSTGAPVACSSRAVVTAPTWEELARARDGGARAQRRGADAQAPRLSLPDRPQAGGLVEVEDRPVHGRRGAALRPARARPAGEPVHRLHLRRLGRAASWCRSPRRTRGSRDEEIVKLDGWVRAPHHAEVRAGARRSSRRRSSSCTSRAIALSPRHKSGIAVRFPRIARWRTDKPASRRTRWRRSSG